MYFVLEHDLLTGKYSIVCTSDSEDEAKREMIERLDSTEVILDEGYDLKEALKGLKRATYHLIDEHGSVMVWEPRCEWVGSYIPGCSYEKPVYIPIKKFSVIGGSDPPPTPETAPTPPPKKPVPRVPKGVWGVVKK